MKRTKPETAKPKGRTGDGGAPATKPAASTSREKPTARKEKPQKKKPDKPTPASRAGMAAKGRAMREANDDLPRRFWNGVPCWMFSAVAHASLLIVLALLMIRSVPQEEAVLHSAMTEPFEPQKVADITSDPLKIEELETHAAKIPDPGAVNLGSLAMVPNQELRNPGVGKLQLDPTGDIGRLFGTNGNGMSEAGLGLGGATFFGVPAKGRKFVFVVDNSLSMGRGKFETAVAELMKSIIDLDRKKQFYVIFFSDTAYPVLYPKPARGMMPATEENKRRVDYWLKTVELCLRTKGEEAMKLAFQLRPDAIFILSDGSFTDNTTEILLGISGSKIRINTLGFRMKPKAEQDMRRIAKHFGGTFTEVEVTPEMVKLDRKLKRPRNREPNGVWGIKLGEKK